MLQQCFMFNLLGYIFGWNPKLFYVIYVMTFILCHLHNHSFSYLCHLNILLLICKEVSI